MVFSLFSFKLLTQLCCWIFLIIALPQKFLQAPSATITENTICHNPSQNHFPGTGATTTGRKTLSIGIPLEDVKMLKDSWNPSEILDSRGNLFIDTRLNMQPATRGQKQQQNNDNTNNLPKAAFNLFRLRVILVHINSHPTIIFTPHSNHTPRTSQAFVGNFWHKTVWF